MIDTSVPSPSGPGGTAPPVATERLNDTTRGDPAHPHTSASRARAFRLGQERQRGARWERMGQLLSIVVILLGIYAITTARPYIPPAGGGIPPLSSTPPGTPIDVQLGNPLVSNLSCAGGGSAYAERIPWMNSTAPLATKEVWPEVYEIWDGDYIRDPTGVASATPTNLCAGNSPASIWAWYVVLATSNGTNLLTYTQNSEWTSLTNGSTNLPLESGLDMVLVTQTSLAGTGRGFGVLGYINDSEVQGSVPL